MLRKSINPFTQYNEYCILYIVYDLRRKFLNIELF